MVATKQAGQPVSDPATDAASRAERWAAALTSALLVAIALFAIPFGARPAGESDALIPALDSGAFVAMLVTAAILRNQFRAGRYIPLAFLAVAYACTALMLLPYTLIFPHGFSPDGFGTAAQAAPWLWVGWHGAFVMLVGAYVWSDSFFSRIPSKMSKALRFVHWYAAAVGSIALLWIGAVIIGHDRLPVLVERSGYSPFYHSIVEQPLLAIVAIVFLTLVARTRLRRATELWLGVALLGVGIEVYVSGTLVRAPFTVGWYICAFQAVVWQSLFLINQLRHANEQFAAFAAEKGSLIEETLRDALTGLYNRRGFDERFSKMAADCRRTGDSLALLALDLDYFKAYNDHFGHAAGDDALRAVGKALGSIANLPMDACCRIGGEEFAIVLAMADETSARTVADRIQKAIEKLAIRHSGEFATHLTASIGLAVSNGVKPVGVRDLYERADSALYRAKRLGRNRVAVYEEVTREERRGGREERRAG
jgi:diguanylate cyclase (GGDEF)-like protein